MKAAMNGAKPALTRATFIWILHGYVGEDNIKMGVLNEKDSTLGQWIKSGARLMLMPKDPKALIEFHTDFFGVNLM